MVSCLGGARTTNCMLGQKLHDAIADHTSDTAKRIILEHEYQQPIQFPKNMTPTRPATFASLPFELRLKIYRHVFAMFRSGTCRGLVDSVDALSMLYPPAKIECVDLLLDALGAPRH